MTHPYLSKRKGFEGSHVNLGGTHQHLKLKINEKELFSNTTYSAGYSQSIKIGID